MADSTVKIYGELESKTVDGVVTKASSISGGYMVLENEAARNSLKPAFLLEGTLIYLTDSKKFQQYIDGVWIDAKFAPSASDITLNANQIKGGFMVLPADTSINSLDNSYKVPGALVYSLANNCYYQYLNGAWVTATFDGSISDLTEAQVQATNSGITADKVSAYDTLTQNALTGFSVNGTNKITANSEKVINLNTDNISILYSGNKLKLPDDWVAYLKNATYKIPTLKLMTSNNATSVEYGLPVSASFTHVETNPDSINAQKIALYKGSTTVATSIEPTTSTSSTIYSMSNEPITSSTSFVLKCIDTNGNERQSNTITYTPYKPVYYGASSSATINSVSTLSKLNRSNFCSGDTPLEITTTDGQYCYLVTSGIVSDIQSGGFGVPYIKQEGTISVTLNGQTLNYNVYRTANAVRAGVNPFVIKQ